MQEKIESKLAPLPFPPTLQSFESAGRTLPRTTRTAAMFVTPRGEGGWKKGEEGRI